MIETIGVFIVLAGFFWISVLWLEFLLPTPKKLPKIISSKPSFGWDMLKIVGLIVLGFIIASVIGILFGLSFAPVLDYFLN